MLKWQLKDDNLFKQDKHNKRDEPANQITYNVFLKTSIKRKIKPSDKKIDLVTYVPSFSKTGAGHRR